jgi:hypothetical protein
VISNGGLLDDRGWACARWCHSKPIVTTARTATDDRSRVPLFTIAFAPAVNQRELCLPQADGSSAMMCDLAHPRVLCVRLAAATTWTDNHAAMDCGSCGKRYAARLACLSGARAAPGDWRIAAAANNSPFTAE